MCHAMTKGSWGGGLRLIRQELPSCPASRACSNLVAWQHSFQWKEYRGNLLPFLLQARLCFWADRKGLPYQEKFLCRAAWWTAQPHATCIPMLQWEGRLVDSCAPSWWHIIVQWHHNQVWVVWELYWVVRELCPLRDIVTELAWSAELRASPSTSACVRLKAQALVRGQEASHQLKHSPWWWDLWAVLLYPPAASSPGAVWLAAMALVLQAAVQAVWHPGWQYPQGNKGASRLCSSSAIRGEALQDPGMCWQSSLGKLLSQWHLPHMPWGCPKGFSLPLAPWINITSNASNVKQTNKKFGVQAQFTGEGQQGKTAGESWAALSMQRIQLVWFILL